jgi:hypothetical protein
MERDRRKVQIPLVKLVQGLLRFGTCRCLIVPFLGNGFGIVHEREAWWRVVVSSKFGSLYGRWFSNEPLGLYGVGLWKNIRRSWGSFASYT